ncbi:hypothetical protein SAMN06265222_109105 [Neorhodopirellula lusitana]|uniref:Uncharacterized protein n=1 Tax=Neorhodopirellula lusitana TaxID=445327 RepID=A0ABY1QCT5_9BACT|nr:hypothetical protein [Neorhodopirellula lusitana]SMP65592.1 hypothetical protein SAMN06265222_109105 [Neorhodopirellula lusitana]
MDKRFVTLNANKLTDGELAELADIVAAEVQNRISKTTTPTSCEGHDDKR